MTEQEAEALAVRLTRIWNPTTPFAFRSLKVEEGFPGTWRFEASLDSEFYLTFDHQIPTRNDIPFPSLAYRGEGEKSAFGVLCAYYYKDRGVVQVHIYSTGSIKRQMAEQSMAMFRRGCWLSGCPIEASAHEKAEWMQGFNREEIDVWNLKM